MEARNWRVDLSVGTLFRHGVVIIIGNTLRDIEG